MLRTFFSAVPSVTNIRRAMPALDAPSAIREHLALSRRPAPAVPERQLPGARIEAARAP